MNQFYSTTNINQSINQYKFINMAAISWIKRKTVVFVGSEFYRQF